MLRWASLLAAFVGATGLTAFGMLSVLAPMSIIILVPASAFAGLIAWCGLRVIAKEPGTAVAICDLTVLRVAVTTVGPAVVTLGILVL